MSYAENGEDIHRDIKDNKNSEVKRQKEIAVREIELMHQAMDSKDYKKAMYHKEIANVAIDEMVGVSEMVKR
jgi:hypothetical protein